jgi:hypothetical protein
MPRPVLQSPSLVWGQLQVVGPATEDTFSIDATRQGTNFGNPESIIEEVRSLLVDGVLSTRTGWTKRDVTIHLRISANDGEAMSEAEAALVQQMLLEPPPPLEWTPPLANAAATVFDTVVADLVRDVNEGWDLDEKWDGFRYYTLTLTCLPFARAVQSTTIPALPVPTDPDTAAWEDIDVCDALTGWTAEASDLDSGPAIATDGSEDYVVASATFANAGQYLRLVRNGVVDMDDLPYLVVDADFSEDASRPRSGNWTVKFDSGSWITPISVVRMTLPTGVTVDRSYFNAPDTFSTLRIAFDITTLVSAPASYDLAVVNVAATDTIGSGTVSTNREQSRLVDVGGSMPTNAVLSLYDATPADLGSDILVYTSRRTDLLPNMRQWLDSSTGVSIDDTARISGARHPLNGDTVFLVPASLLALGSYSVVGMLDVDVAGTLSWQARMVTSGGAATVGSGVVVAGEVDLDVTDGYQVLALASLVLPVVEVEGSNHALELTLSGTADMSMDEGWLFSLDDGALTWLKDDEGLDWIEIRSPELGAARPSVWGGRNALGSNPACVDWKCESFGAHRFEPGTMQIFTVTSTSLASQCDIEFFPRYHSHVMGSGTS